MAQKSKRKKPSAEAVARYRVKQCQRKSPSLQVCRKRVFNSTDPNARAGTLKKSQLRESTSKHSRKIVSLLKSKAAYERYHAGSGLKKWNAAAAARDENGFAEQVYDEF